MNTKGSNAYTYDYSADSEAFYVPEIKVEHNKILIKEIKNKENDIKIKKRIISGIALLMALGVVVAVRYASVTQINYENHNLEQQYDDLMAVAENLEVEIESSMSIAEIAEKAETKLGMHKPLSYQVRYIDVESLDQTEYNNTEFTNSNEENMPFYKRLSSRLKLFLGLI